MIRSLEIRNYRNLRHLTIENLGRVNLFVGKNNTGKTSVLEAILFLTAFRNELSLAKHLLERRGEFIPNKDQSVSDTNLKRLASFFNRQDIDFFNSSKNIYIGVLPPSNSPEHSLEIGFQKAYAVLKKNDAQRELYEYIPALSPEELNQTDFRYQLVLTRGLYQTTYPLAKEALFDDGQFKTQGSPSQFQYIDSFGKPLDTVQKLWANIALTDNEDVIIEALKIVDSSIERVSVIEGQGPIVRLKDGYISLLSSMGDGVNRIFMLLLAVVNSRGSYLLIDEFENGLHYSVQEKIWKVIFQLAIKLNIQVFATTHSSDAIKAFEMVINQQNNYQDAELIKLRNMKGNISAVTFNAEELKIANETEYLDLR